MKIFVKIPLVSVIGFLLFFILPVKGQRLNETYLQAKADIKRKEYAAAEQKILSIPAHERSSQMYLTVGECFYMQEKYDEAARYFAMSDSLRSNPEAELYAARSYAMMLQPAKAAQWLEQYLSQRDKLSESELTLDPAFEKIEHSKEWKTLWNKDWYNAAERKAAEVAVLLKRKRYTDALEIVDTEIIKGASARFYALRAKLYEEMEQFEPAHESAQTAISMRTNNSDYFIDAAQIAVRVKKYEIALDNINRAIRLDPYQLDLYLQRASILSLSQRHDEASNDINFYFKYLPDDTRVIFQMAVSETEAGNPLAGIEHLTKLIDNDNTSTEYYMARANAGIKANNYTLASYDLSQALDLNPYLPDAWHKKGIVLFQENKVKDACFHWKRALELGNRESAEFIYKYCIK